MCRPGKFHQRMVSAGFRRQGIPPGWRPGFGERIPPYRNDFGSGAFLRLPLPSPVGFSGLRLLQLPAPRQSSHPWLHAGVGPPALRPAWNSCFAATNDGSAKSPFGKHPPPQPLCPGRTKLPASLSTSNPHRGSTPIKLAAVLLGKRYCLQLCFKLPMETHL